MVNSTVVFLRFDVTTQAVSPVIKTCGNHNANIVGCTWLEAAVLCVLLCACTAVCVFIGSITIYGYTRDLLNVCEQASAVGGYYGDVKSPWCVYMKMDTFIPHYLLLAQNNGCMLSYKVDNEMGRGVVFIYYSRSSWVRESKRRLAFISTVVIAKPIVVLGVQAVLVD